MFRPGTHSTASGNITPPGAWQLEQGQQGARTGGEEKLKHKNRKQRRAQRAIDKQRKGTGTDRKDVWLLQVECVGLEQVVDEARAALLVQVASRKARGLAGGVRRLDEAKALRVRFARDVALAFVQTVGLCDEIADRVVNTAPCLARSLVLNGPCGIAIV